MVNVGRINNFCTKQQRHSFLHVVGDGLQCHRCKCSQMTTEKTHHCRQVRMQPKVVKSYFAMKEHQKTLTFGTVSKVSDSVPLLISMKENYFSCVQKSEKCVTEITLY